MIYRHYGTTADKFRIDHIYEGAGLYKPKGLWACPEYAIDEWKDWCEGEDYKVDFLSEHFDFTLKPETKILRIKDVSDILPYCKSDDIAHPCFCYTDPTIDKILDLEKIYREFDGMEVDMRSGWSLFHDSKLFYTWDVSSIVIWYLSRIIPV